MFLIFIGILIAAGIGVAAKVVFDQLGGDLRISAFELAAGFAICTLVLVPLVTIVGTKMALANDVTFKEYWNGYETAANKLPHSCSENSGCRHTYDCDPVVHYTYDSKGNVNGSYTTYSQCPYSDVEIDYTVSTTLGTYTYATGVFPSDWQNHGYRHGIPSYIAQEAGTSDPPAWLAAKARIDSGVPGPVTAVKPYKNYILASQSTILHHYSDAVTKYKAAGNLPRPSRGVHDLYLADKAYFVGFTPSNVSAWQDAVSRFDAAIGTEKQGDFHLVVVADGADGHTVTTNPDEYTSALIAYWQSPAMGKEALSKNGLVLVVGTDGTKVTWARVTTGMPSGNENLIQDARSALNGVAFTPEALLGSPTGHLENGKVTITHGQGAFENLVWSPSTGFIRQCMACKSKGDTGISFSYLGGDIQPNGGQKFWIEFMAGFTAALMWTAFVFINPVNRKRRGASAFSDFINPFSSSSESE